MTLERRAWWIGRVLALLLVLVSLRAAYWQLWRGMALDPVAYNPAQAAREYAALRGDGDAATGESEAADLASLPQPVIQRTVAMLANTQRGKIFDRDGNLLAEDVGSPGSYTRVYTEPSLAHVIGYASALRTGIMGLEATYNRDLLGLDRPDTQIDRMLHRPVYGSSLTLTIDSEIQRAAAEGLAGRAGAVVALDGETGAVLAMASAPTFDPNQIINSEYAASLGESSALINRATQSLYTPGSIFKTVTMIASLDSGSVTPETVFDFGEPHQEAGTGRTYYTWTVNGGVIYDPNHSEDRLSLEMCYVRSANVAFAKMAYDLPADTFIDYGQRLGFSAKDYTGRFPLELVVAEPALAYNLDDLRTNDLLRAHTGYGQGELLTTPLNMAMVVEAVLNDGAIPVPYLVEDIRDPQGAVIQRKPNDHTVRGVMSAQTADTVRQAMISMVTTYYGDYLPGAVVGGKTGTAEVGEDRAPHGWFIGFAEQGERSIVIAVVLDNAGAGSQTALPVFRQVAAAWLE